VDDFAQITRVTRRVHVDSSPSLVEPVSAPGVIWDVSGSRVLYVDSSGATPVLRHADLATSVVQDIEAAPELVGGDRSYGRLTAAGAIYEYQGPDATSACNAFEWRGGSAIALGTVSPLSLRAAGEYAILSQGNTLVLRDLSAGTSSVVAADAAERDNDVAANGDLAYWTSDGAELIWRHQGVEIPMACGAALCEGPVTDGTSVAFARCTAAAPLRCDIVLHDGVSESTLSANQSSEPRPHGDYAVAGSVAAYTAEDSKGTRQVWRHDGSGEEQLTFFSTASRVDPVLPDGTVLLVHGTRRYRGTPGSSLEDVCSSQGTLVVRAGAPYVLMGGSAFRLRP
jgi:hypothetical protein